jgi:hypothetical protein
VLFVWPSTHLAFLRKHQSGKKNDQSGIEKPNPEGFDQLGKAAVRERLGHAFMLNIIKIEFIAQQASSLAIKIFIPVRASSLFLSPGALDKFWPSR